MRRRTVLTAVSGLTALAAANGALARPLGRRRPKGRTYVLVHGAWHGGWCWRFVTERLRARGAQVFTPTLTGLGERAHLRTPTPRLETHIADVLGVLTSEDLHDVVLVGHSYGGMVITGVVDRAADRLSQVVYLDAALPKHGQSMITQNADADPDQALAQLAALAPDGVWMSPPPTQLFGIPSDHPKFAWVERRLSAHPLPTWTDPIALTERAGSLLPKTYVLCTAPALPNTAFPAHARRIEAGSEGANWRVTRLATGHDAMITAPDDLAEILAS